MLVRRPALPFCCVWLLSIIVLASTLLSGSAMAQPAALDRDHSTSALIEFSHPYLQSIEASGLTVLDDPGTSNGILHLAVRQKVSPKLAILVDVPFDHYDWTLTQVRYVRSDTSVVVQYDTVRLDKSGTNIGNVYIGVETLKPGSALIWDAGLRINSSPNGNGAFVGVFTDITQWAAFVNSFSTYFGLRTHSNAAKNVVGSFRGGVSLFKFETGDIWLNGGATARARLGSWSLAPAVDGVYAFSDFRPFSEHLVGQMEFAVGHEGPHLRPELVARYYLNSTWREFASWSLGFRLGGF